MPYHYKCPSKINLFLNVLNKRPDGYHSIQSIFQLINLYDSLKLSLRNDDKVTIKCNKKELESDNIILFVCFSFFITFSTALIANSALFF